MTYVQTTCCAKFKASDQHFCSCSFQILGDLQSVVMNIFGCLFNSSGSMVGHGSGKCNSGNVAADLLMFHNHLYKPSVYTPFYIFTATFLHTHTEQGR